MLQLDRFRRTTVLIAVALLAASCSAAESEDGATDVDVRAITTDIGLGLDKGFEPAPANMAVQQPPARPVSTRPPRLNLPAFDLKEDDDELGGFLTCDPPPLTASPELVADIYPTGRPKPGFYVWQMDGVLQTLQGPQEIDVQTARVIADVEEHEDIEGAYRFTDVQTLLLDARTGSVVATRYLVIPESPAKRQGVQSDAGEGVFIERIERFNQGPDGGIEHVVFNSQPPVQILAFPVQVGQVIDSTGVDPVSLSRLTVRGEVKNKVVNEDGEEEDRRVIEACGERIDSWFVEGEMRFEVTHHGQQPPNPFAAPDPDRDIPDEPPNPADARTDVIEANYNYNVATQFGGMIVGEFIETPKDGPVLTLNLRIGTVDPFVADGAAESPESGEEPVEP